VSAVVARRRLVAAVRHLGSVRALELAAQLEVLPDEASAWDEVMLAAYEGAMSEHAEALDAADAAQVALRRLLAEQQAQVERADACLAIARLLWEGPPAMADG
jgi:hypothetical protein